MDPRCAGACIEDVISIAEILAIPESVLQTPDSESPKTFQGSTSLAALLGDVVENSPGNLILLISLIY